VAGAAGHLHPRDADQPVLRCQFCGFEARVDLVVVGDRQRVEPDGRRLFGRSSTGSRPSYDSSEWV